MSEKEPKLSPLPDNIEIVTEYDAIVLRRTWKSAAAYFLIVFTLFWNGFMAVWMGIAIKQGAWEMAAFGTIHAAVGIFIVYYTVALFINKTDIRIDTYNLSIKHYPLPWFGQTQIPVEHVKQVYCEKKINRGKNSTHITHEVRYLDQNRRKKKLISGLNDADQARFIESEIEKTLGIKDRAVSGEIQK